MTPPAGSPERAALAYFGLIFAAGFIMGTIRVLLVEPRLGPSWSVALELPVMLGLSAFAARWLAGLFAVEPAAPALLRMGLVALALLVAAETVLGLCAFGQSIADQVTAYASPRGILTLAGQIGFGLMPLLVARRRPA